jgi:rod shape-determining protein MreD
LFLVALIAALVVRLIVGGNLPDLLYFAPAVTQTLLWPVAMLCLLAPQRRAVERDENRPI